MATRDDAAQSRGPRSAVAVILLTWNGWEDAIECLDSVFRATYPSYHVFVCDNGSQRADCLGAVEAWARGEAPFRRPAASPVQAHDVGKLANKLTIRRIDYPEDRGRATPDGSWPDLTLIQTGKNRGYAGGNNVGIRYALKQADIGHVWILNPDTVVCPETMASLVSYSRSHPGMGLIGSMLLWYEQPSLIQSAGGGSWIPHTATAPHFLKDSRYEPGSDYGAYDAKLEWIHGASAFVTRRFIESVGPMREFYFLYNEEIDWGLRATRRSDLKLGLCPDAIVYHKKGTAQKSVFSFRRWFYLTRNKLVVTAIFFPRYLPNITWIVLKILWGRVDYLLRPYGVHTVRFCQRMLRFQRR